MEKLLIALFVLYFLGFVLLCVNLNLKLSSVHDRISTITELMEKIFSSDAEIIEFNGKLIKENQEVWSETLEILEIDKKILKRNDQLFEAIANSTRKENE